MRMLQRRVDKIAYVSAILIFTAGFGAMLLFWLNSDYMGERGLYYYFSATIGDAMVLPLIAFIGTRLNANFELTSKRLLTLLVVAVCGAGIGLATQVAWLRSDETILNWTFREPHTFNGAGWYHAAFLVIVSGYFAGLVYVVASQYRHHSAPNEHLRVQYLCLLALIVTFVALQATDNHRALSPPSNLDVAWKPAIVSISMAIIVKIVARDISGWRVAQLGAFLVLYSTSLSALLVMNEAIPGARVLLALASGTALTCAVASASPRSISTQLSLNAPGGVLVAACALNTPTGLANALMIVGSATAVAALLLSMTRVGDGRPWWEASMDALATGSLLGIAQVLMIDTGLSTGGTLAFTTLVCLFFTAIVRMFVAPHVSRGVAMMIQAEVENSDGLSRVRTIAYIRAGSITLLGVVVLLLWLGAFESYVDAAQAGDDARGLYRNAAAQMLIAAIGIGLIAARRRPVLRAAALGLASVAVTSFALVEISRFGANQQLLFLLAWTAVVGATFAALFSIEAFGANLHHLPGRGRRRGDTPLTLASGCLVASSTLLFLSSVLRGGRRERTGCRFSSASSRGSVRWPHFLSPTRTRTLTPQ